MELNIKTKNNIITNISILYSISAIMIIFFDINNFKIILDNSNIVLNIDNFQYKIFLLLFLNILIVCSYLLSGFYIINLDIHNSKKYVFYYSLQSIVQFIKPIYIFYSLYNNNNKQLNISILFNLYSLLLNMISIKMIIRYKKIFNGIN